MQMSQQNQERMHTQQTQRPRSLREVVQDPHANWSEIRQAMKSLKVCTHEGLSQIIKKASPNPSYGTIEPELEEQSKHLHWNAQDTNNFDPTTSEKDCIRKKSIYVFRRKSKDDLSLTLATQRKEKRRSLKKQRRRSSRDDISIGSLSGTSLEDLGLDEEDLLCFDDSDSASDTSSEGDCHFLDWAHNSKKGTGASDENSSVCSNVDDVKLEDIVCSFQEASNEAQDTSPPSPIAQPSHPPEPKRGIFRRFSLDMRMLKSDSSTVEKSDSMAEKETDIKRVNAKEECNHKSHHQAPRDDTAIGSKSTSQKGLGFSSNKEDDESHSRFQDWSHNSKDENDANCVHESEESNANSSDVAESKETASSSQEFTKPRNVLTDKRKAMKRVNSKDDLHLFVAQESKRDFKLKSYRQGSRDDISIIKQSSRKDLGLSDDEDDDNGDCQFLDWAHNSKVEIDAACNRNSRKEESQPTERSSLVTKQKSSNFSRHTVLTHKHPSELLSLLPNPSFKGPSLESEITKQSNESSSYLSSATPPQRNRRFKRLSMDMVKQQTNELIHAATHRPSRSRSLDKLNHSDSKIDTETIRRALLNDMSGQGREARAKQMQTLHCSKV